MIITNDTPIAMLTVGQFKKILDGCEKEEAPIKEDRNRYVYGIAGIARLFNCSRVTANKIKKSGKIDAAIKQIGRKIIVDADLALELINKYNC